MAPARWTPNWTEDDVRAIALNPTYAGLGPFPAFPDMTDEKWVRVALTLADQEGAEPTLAFIRKMVLETFPDGADCVASPTFATDTAARMALVGAAPVLSRLLQDLRHELRDAVPAFLPVGYDAVAVPEPRSPEDFN